MRLLIVTNDSTVFLHKRSRTDEMFGGRVTEIKRFCERLSTEHDVTFSIISGEYGFVMGDRIIESYDTITDSIKTYHELQQRTDFISDISRISGSYDVTLMFMPKEMMRMVINFGEMKGKVIAATSSEFKDEFERRGWSFYERRGARIGNINSKKIIAELSGASVL